MATDRTSSTRGRRSRREPGVPVHRVHSGIMARGVGKTKREGSAVASSSSAMSVRDLPPPPPPYSIGAFRSLRLLEESEEHVAEPASGQTQQQLDVSSSKNLLETTTLKELSITATSSSSLQDTIWVREQYDWGLTFYTRIDRRGYFHTYPHVGGPFHSLGEVNNAIDRYLHDRHDPMMCKERHEFYEVGKASVERSIRDRLYWPNGSKKMYVKSEPIDESRCWMLQLVQALVDKYNEDCNLFEDLALELKDVVCYQVIYECNCRHYHTNFTTKPKGAKTSNNLCFAEVTRMPGEDAKLVVSCTCMVDPFDNGCCYGCESRMKHPNADVYTGGHSKVCGLDGGCPGPNIDIAETMDDWKAEEARVRKLFEGLDDPSVVAPLMEPPKFNFGAIKATDEEVERFMESIMGPYDPNCGSTYGIIDASTAERFRVALK